MNKIVLFSISALFMGVSMANASTFTSAATGNWNIPATWTVTGVADADGIPDTDDDVIITTGKTITQDAAVGICKTINVNTGGTYNQNNKILRVYGNCTIGGTLSNTGQLHFRAFGTLTATNPITNNGDWYFYSSYSIGAGTTISKINNFTLQSGVTVTNNGSVSLNSGSLILSGNWINAANSSLLTGANITNPLGTGSITASAVPNTVTYKGTSLNIFTSTSYYNLSLTSASAVTKILLGPNPLVVANDLSIGINNTLNCNNLNITVGGNWTNSANISCTNMATVTFNGSGTQTITRGTTEFFNNLTHSGTGTLVMGNNVTTNGTTTLSSGVLNISTFTYSQKGASWLGNGGTMTLGTSGIVTFNGTANQTIGGTVGTTFGHVIINNPGFTVSLTSNNTASGNTTLYGGTFDPSTFNWHMAGAVWSANGGTINTAATGSIIFDGSVAQTIGGSVGATFGTIQIASSNTVSLARDLVTVKSLTISSGTLDVTATPYNVTVAGDFVHSGGSFTQQTGTVFLNGTAAQTVSGTTTFYDLNSTNTSGGVAVTGAITVSDILTVASTSFGTSGAGTITIPATGATTAGKIAPLGAGASLTGSGWIIQTFINGPATANWQYLGSPINGNVLSDWDNDTRFYMSGVGGNDGNTSPMFYSVRKYSTVDTWVNITTVATALTPGKGFSCWMADNTTGLTSPLIFDSRGVPNFGNKSIALNSAHYTLAANPYACPISFASVVAASSGANANFLCWQESGSYVTNPNSGNIATAQGFMAYAASGGTLNFTEACKNTAANPNVVRTADPENYIRIRTSNDINGLGGETVIQIKDDAANGLDANYDLPFIASMYEDATNIWSTDAAGTDLLLNALNSTPDNLDIPLTVVAGTSGNQLISFLGLTHLSAYSYATLENVATGEKVNLNVHDTYSFFAQNVGDKKNFILHLARTGNCPNCNQNITTSLDASTLVYTNNSMIHVKFDFETATDVVINVSDVQGQEVTDSKNVTVGTQIVDINEVVAHGIYFVRITRGDEVVTKKIYL